jgi:hypothetical protein
MMEANNPYAPPKAAVNDVSSGVEPPRPPQVNRALQLLWTAVAVSFGSGILNAYLTETPDVPRGMYVAFMIVGWVVGFLITWWLLSSIGKGKNWARIVELVLFLFGILGILMVFRMPQEVSPVIWVLYAVQMGLNVWGFVLLFSAPANGWFREMKEWYESR